MTADGRYVVRFTPTERALHWVHATSFFVLLATGVALYVPALTEALGSRTLLRNVHLVTAIGWAVALVAVFVMGDRRTLRSNSARPLFVDWQSSPAGRRMNSAIFSISASQLRSVSASRCERGGRHIRP